jgi:hypothetical protein
MPRWQGRQKLGSLVWVNHPHTDCCCHCPTPIGCLPGLQGWPSTNSCYQCIAAKCEGHVNGIKALNISKYNLFAFFFKRKEKSNAEQSKTRTSIPTTTITATRATIKTPKDLHQAHNNLLLGRFPRRCPG